MAKKKNQNKPKAKPQIAPKVEITPEIVISSESKEEFEKNKQDFIDNFLADIQKLEKEKEKLEKAVSQAEKSSKDLEQKRIDIEENRKKLQAEYDEIKEKYENAKGTVEKAESDAKEILENAEKARIDTLAKADEEARDAWKKKCDELVAQLKDVSEREEKVHEAQIKLEKERQAFSFEKEELDELSAHVQKLKERYISSNPTKVQELEIELSDEKNKYTMLLEKYEGLSGRLKECQILLDTIKTEVEDSAGNKKISSMTEIVTAMQEFKEKYEKIAEIYSKYPDDESISSLEYKAQKVDKLEKENDALEQERDRYREEAIAARNASKELEVVRQEVEATNALNEHLLQELESHKTALESRTGDTCPSLSKVDVETEETDFINDINARKQRNQIQSLKELVSHVKNYAGSRNKEEQLFYTDNDIRSFLSGMAVSRLIILQGMSGTGKSSLPRIFSEAISGFNRLIPVESSWRDRNELLGYYNDFNKKFNAKSFTIELYRSSKERCREIPTFIVLDEMNLARIEYYFSDFLAILQEPNHEKWLIELVSSDMRTLPMELPENVKQKMQKEAPSIFAIWEKIERSRQGDFKAETSDEEKEELTSYLAKLGRLTGAKDLIAGRKIKVTDNIWFVGTANKDESTFEISDKVYDRAQVVSLNKKGVPEGNYINTEKKYISVTDIQQLFETAISDFKKKSEVEERLNLLDDTLMEKFDVSFGNRIVKQTLDFVAVFTAAGGTVEDALDYQISTKILRKVLSSDDGEALLELLEATTDYPETQRLINKRIKDLR